MPLFFVPAFNILACPEHLVNYYWKGKIIGDARWELSHFFIRENILDTQVGSACSEFGLGALLV